jgi:UPF0176 protein
MKKLYVLLFYKFTNIEDPKKLKDNHLKFCKSLGLFGRVLIANEGINGSVCGTKDQIENYKNYFSSNPKFSGIVFKEDEVISQIFTKMQVKVKKEIVTFQKSINYENRAEYINSEELYKIYKENPKEIVILDTRNDYEYKVGKFKNAIHLNIKNFREFPEALNKIENLKDKKIVTYCTGGIRCEKAATYMKENGFKNVYQLKDGILNFGKKFPDTFWEGKCFVFDKRLIAPINSPNSEKNTITECENCGVPCDLYKNCRNVNCDRLVILCLDCQKRLIGCCSESCKHELQKQFLEKSFRKQNRNLSQTQ